MRALIPLIIITLVACSSNNKEIVQLETDVIALHDEVMPLMDSLYKMRKQLQKEVELDSSKVELTDAIDGIVIAEESMLNWMRNYDPNFQGTESETIKYLTEKKASIQQVAIQMRASLKTGDGLIKNADGYLQ